jgi:hypothetical protein
MIFDSSKILKTEWPIKNGQSRDAGHIGDTSHGTKVNQTKTQKRKRVNLVKKGCIELFKQ